MGLSCRYAQAQRAPARKVPQNDHYHITPARSRRIFALRRIVPFFVRKEQDDTVAMRLNR